MFGSALTEPLTSLKNHQLASRTSEAMRSFLVLAKFPFLSSIHLGRLDHPSCEDGLFLRQDNRIKLLHTFLHSERAFYEGIKYELLRVSKDERHVLCYIHGYNVNFRGAAIRAAQIGFDLKVPGVTAFFSWPSMGILHGYAADAATIEASEAAITRFLVDLCSKVDATHVHIIAHSMGNRGLLRALQRICNDIEQRTRTRFSQVFLAAPDLDAGLFHDLARLIPDISTRTTLYVSPRDNALKFSKIIHGAPRVGFCPPVTVVDGIDTVFVPGTNLLELGHSYYAEFEAVLHDMYDLIRFNSPPSARQRLSLEHDQEARYWSVRL